MTNDDPFELHPRLANDCELLDQWPLSVVLLCKDANYPWLILVPRRPGLRDFHDLAERDLAMMTNEIVRASRSLKEVFAPTKINVAALGNEVPQLHLHVIARFAEDAAWPGPVWGVAPVKPYSKEQLEQQRNALGKAFRQIA